MRRSFRALLPLAALVVFVACGGSSDAPATTPAPTPDAGASIPSGAADIRADSNRDGAISFADATDADKTTWDAHTGAIFLANIDDDSERCPKTGTDLTLAKCNDAANTIVDGADDLLDLAHVQTKAWAEAPDDATATVTVGLTPAGSTANVVRLFVRNGDASDPKAYAVYASGDPIAVDAIRAGVDLAVEAKDIVRDPATWDGYVTLTWTITTSAGTATDAVKLRVAPVLTSHHLLPAETVFVSNVGDSGNKLTRQDLAKACTAASIGAPEELDVNDQWTQDFFETGYMSMPGAGGAQQVMHVAYRSANVDDPSDKNNPLRSAGQWVFDTWRGKDKAGIQQFDANHDEDMDSLNSFGNLETIPPYSLNGTDYKFGRVIRGKTDTFFPDPSFVKMVEAQGQQPPVYIDTSWLLVGHVDETISFIKASSPRGWAVLVNDAAMAKQMLEDQVAKGNGDVHMFIGEKWYDDFGKSSPAEISISDVLADTDVMETSAKAVVEVQGQIDKLKTEVGLTDDELIHIPYLHMSVQGYSLAYQPGTVNGVYISDTHFVTPDPHGPQIDGVDIFKAQIEKALQPYGITVDYVEDWDDYHAAEGEIHCGSNTLRKVPEIKWWESAR